MLASVDKKCATLADILRAEGYGLGGASEQAVEQAIQGLALGAETVQGCALECVVWSQEGRALLAWVQDSGPIFSTTVSLSLLCHTHAKRKEDCKHSGAPLAQQYTARAACWGVGEVHRKKQQRLARRSDVRRYVEVHIEQGVTLEGLDVPVAPVRAIAGQTRLAVMFKGMQARPACLTAMHGLHHHAGDTRLQHLGYCSVQTCRRRRHRTDSGGTV